MSEYAANDILPQWTEDIREQADLARKRAKESPTRPEITPGFTPDEQEK